jgi:hypothetical protein
MYPGIYGYLCSRIDTDEGTEVMGSTKVLNLSERL